MGEVKPSFDLVRCEAPDVSLLTDIHKRLIRTIKLCSKRLTPQHFLRDQELTIMTKKGFAKIFAGRRGQQTLETLWAFLEQHVKNIILMRWNNLHVHGLARCEQDMTLHLFRDTVA